jgi:spore germination protein (amino acid permease)
MSEKKIVNPRQIGFLTAALLTGGGLISVQNVLIRLSHGDTWFTYVLPTVYAFLVIALFGYLSKLFPKKQLYEITFELFGKWFGGLLNVLLLAHLWFSLTRDMSLFNRFFSTTLLPRTPLEILTLLLVGVLVFYGRTSLEVVARVSDIVFPLFVLIMLAAPVVLLNEIRFSYLQPVMTTSLWDFAAGGTIASGWYGDIFAMGAFIHMIYSHQELKAGLRRGVLLATMLLTLSILTEVAVFGPFLPGNFIYPSYNLVQQIHITDFLDRVDIVMLMVWFPIACCKLCTIYIALLIGINTFMHKSDQHVLNKPVGTLLLIVSLAAFRSTTEVFDFGNFSTTAIVLATQPLLIVLLFLRARMRMRHKRLESAPPTRDVPPGNQGSDGEIQGSVWKRLSARYPYPTWLRAGNVIVVGQAVVACAGFIFGRQYAWVGNVCGLLFVAGVVLLLFTTFAEVKTARPG